MCGQALPSLVLLVTCVEWLDIGEGRSNGQVAADRTQWLEQLLHPFIAVGHLCLLRRLGPLTLPEEVVQEVEPFVAARQVLGIPVSFQEL